MYCLVIGKSENLSSISVCRFRWYCCTFSICCLTVPRVFSSRVLGIPRGYREGFQSSLEGETSIVQCFQRWNGWDMRRKGVATSRYVVMSIQCWKSLATGTATSEDWLKNARALRSRICGTMWDSNNGRGQRNPLLNRCIVFVGVDS